MIMVPIVDQDSHCYHCGEICEESIHIDDKAFCCQGCKTVYQLLQQKELGNYYCMNTAPGRTMDKVQPEKFRFLDDPSIASRLYAFKSEQRAHVVLYLPQIHCSSCLWLLEHLDNILEGVIASHVDFAKKELAVSFRPELLSLKQLAETLASIGYEPYISLQDADGREVERQKSQAAKKAAYKLGVTGFCFANIMLISFPEYLGMRAGDHPELSRFFHLINFCLALPVFFYGAREFFVNAFLSFRQRYLNIDAPIALAIAVTFGRSIYEIASGTGAGYFDSMSGIVFFMLLGRTLQNRTYAALSFNRDYRSYFPVAVTVIQGQEEKICKLGDVREGDRILIHHQEIVPTDCVLSKGEVALDYSFITGESQTESTEIGGQIYAGARNIGAGVEVIALRPFDQTSFARLWDGNSYKSPSSDRESRVSIISKYFSLVVLAIALSAFAYWQVVNPQHAWNALTAVMIVACPCALLLTATFTNGYLLDFFAQQGLFLKNAQVLAALSQADHIAFDKTGTLSEPGNERMIVAQNLMSEAETQSLVDIISQSLHPLSMAIVKHYRALGIVSQSGLVPMKETTGKGLEGWASEKHYKIGSYDFVHGTDKGRPAKTEVHVSIDGLSKACFQFETSFKKGIEELLPRLGDRSLSLISGDNDNSRAHMERSFPPGSRLLYRQLPEQKLGHVQELQRTGKRVIMIGDGLNDAGALKQSDVGIAVVNKSFSFSPACDAILEAGNLRYLDRYIALAKTGQRLIVAGFAYSVLFNLIGIGFAITAHLSPLVAAILMPSSSFGIMAIAFWGIRWAVKKQFPGKDGLAAIET